MPDIQLNRERLAEARKALGITKQEAAKRMQISQPTYLRYESGERTPSIQTLQIMADTLNTSVAYLTNKSDNSKPTSYIIHSDSEPALFQIIETFKASSDEEQAQLLAYLKQIHQRKPE